MPNVEITQSGRGGSIYYRELDHVAVFDWEFALPPALALIFGANAQGWDARYPWAAGRQGAVYRAVGEEVVRQQAAGGSFTVDLEGGVIEILHPAPPPRERVRRDRTRHAPTRSPALERFVASAVPPWAEWPDGRTYDVDALAGLTPAEREDAERVLTSRDPTWREVEALAALDTPGARSALHEAAAHRLSIDTRLAAAEALHRRDASFDVVRVLTRAIRALDRPANGLERALRLAERHDGPAVRQALLWASWNATDCAPACAALLMRLAGVATTPPDDAHERILAGLGLHTSYFERREAFDALCRLVGMELDPSAADD